MSRASDRAAGGGGGNLMDPVDLTVASDQRRPADNTTPRDNGKYSTAVRGERCTAKAKATGVRCRRLIKGGGVCPVHGGAAAQVRRAREARIAVAEARALYADQHAERAPGEVLLAAVTDADAVVQQLKAKLELSGNLLASDLDVLGVWLDRASRMARAALDANVQERRAQLDEANSVVVFELIRGVVLDLGHQLTDQHVQKVLAERLAPLSAGASS